MVFGQGVRSLIGVCRDALCAGDIDERVVVSLVSLLGDRADGIQLFGGIEKAFIAAGNIVVDLDAEDFAGHGVGNDLVGAFSVEPVGADADVVGPVLIRRNGL